MCKFVIHDLKKDERKTKRQKEYKECVATLDGIIDMRARREIGEEDYKRRIGDAQKEKKRLEELLKDAGGKIDSWVKTADEAFEFVEHAQMKFKNGTWEKKREILLTLGSNLILKDKKLDINMEKTLIPMKTVSHESKKILETVRTAKKPLNKKEIERLYARCPSMLPSLDKFRTVDWKQIIREFEWLKLPVTMPVASAL